jgi:CRP-like cAMP-binding protein
MSHSPEPRPPTNNRILAALPPDEYERFAPHLKRVEMRLGEVLCPAGEIIDHVYFPENSMISLLSRTPDGASVEVGVVGYEGMVGLPLVLGVDQSPHETMVQLPDGALRVRAHGLESASCPCYEIMKAEFDRLVA